MKENKKEKLIMQTEENTKISELLKEQIEESEYPVVGAKFNNEYKLWPKTSLIGFSFVEGTAYLNIAPPLKPHPLIVIPSNPLYDIIPLITARAAGNISARTEDNPFIFIVLSNSKFLILPYMPEKSLFETS